MEIVFSSSILCVPLKVEREKGIRAKNVHWRRRRPRGETRCSEVQAISAARHRRPDRWGKGGGNNAPRRSMFGRRRRHKVKYFWALSERRRHYCRRGEYSVRRQSRIGAARLCNHTVTELGNDVVYTPSGRRRHRRTIRSRRAGVDGAGWVYDEPNHHVENGMEWSVVCFFHVPWLISGFLYSVSQEGLTLLE